MNEYEITKIKKYKEEVKDELQQYNNAAWHFVGATTLLLGASTISSYIIKPKLLQTILKVGMITSGIIIDFNAIMSMINKKFRIKTKEKFIELLEEREMTLTKTINN